MTLGLRQCLWGGRAWTPCAPLAALLLALCFAGPAHACEWPLITDTAGRTLPDAFIRITVAPRTGGPEVERGLFMGKVASFGPCPSSRASARALPIQLANTTGTQSTCSLVAGALAALCMALSWELMLSLLQHACDETSSSLGCQKCLNLARCTYSVPARYVARGLWRCGQGCWFHRGRRQGHMQFPEQNARRLRRRRCGIIGGKHVVSRVDRWGGRTSSHGLPRGHGFAVQKCVHPRRNHLLE